MHTTTDSAYCYYHDKLQRGLITTILDIRQELVTGEVLLSRLRAGNILLYSVRDRDGQVLVPANTPLTAGQVRQVREHVQTDTVPAQYLRRQWVEIPPQTRYPVWPLPKNGYQVEVAA